MQFIKMEESGWLRLRLVFDSTLLGGDRVVSRESGDTLQKELRAAIQSTPDAIGLISWNEFSENSHIEPSQVYGYRYIEILADTLPLTHYPK